MDFIVCFFKCVVCVYECGNCLFSSVREISLSFLLSFACLFRLLQASASVLILFIGDLNLERRMNNHVRVRTKYDGGVFERK